MTLQQIIGYVLAIIVGGLGLAIVVLVFIRKINIDDIFQEDIGEGKKATSLSKFQFLIFTFVIGLSLFLITVTQNNFPAVPSSILALLGISAGTAVVSNGITSAQRTRLADIARDRAVHEAEMQKEIIISLSERNPEALTQYLNHLRP